MSLTQREKYLGILVVSFWLVLIPFSLVIVSINGNPSNPTLQFGSWVNYQDNDYSQGIAYIEVYGNSTGSFKLHENLTYWESGCQVNASASVQLIIGYVANRTQLGWDLTNHSLGQNFIKFNVTVVHMNETTIFTQQNGTYVINYYLEYDLFVFEHSIILNFETEYNTVYAVTIHYENNYGGGFIKNYEYINDMTNTTWDEYKRATTTQTQLTATINRLTSVGESDNLLVREDSFSGCSMDYMRWMEVSITYMSPTTTEVQFAVRNSTSAYLGFISFYAVGYYTFNLGGFDYNIDTIKQLYMYGVSGHLENKTFDIDYVNIYTWEKALFGYWNDMSNTSWVDASPYALPVDAGTDMYIEDDEGGHTWGAVNDTGLSIDLSIYPYLEIFVDEGTNDVNWDSWGLRLLWANGSSYYVWYQEAFVSGGEHTYNVLSLCDGTNTVITDIEIVCWGDDDLGDDLQFNYLNIYDNALWYDQEVEIVLHAETFEGWFNAWIVFLGLAIIPMATIYLALKYKSGDLDTETLFIGLLLLVLGWGLFFGGLI